jgi:hypothetical protein
MVQLVSEKQKTAFDSLKNTLGWENIMQTLKVDKVIVSVGVGKMTKEKGKIAYKKSPGKSPRRAVQKSLLHPTRHARATR